MRNAIVIFLGTLCMVMTVRVALGAVYEVGPGREFARISDCPVYDLQAGDVVKIYAKCTPYYEKFFLHGRGTAEQPIRVVGVNAADGSRPVIDGSNALTNPEFDFLDQDDRLIQVGQEGYEPADHIVIENLIIRNAHAGKSFVDTEGVIREYARDAAGIGIDNAGHVVVRDCDLMGLGNGIQQGDDVVEHLTVDRCSFHSNGIGAEVTVDQHHIDLAAGRAERVTVQFCRFGGMLNYGRALSARGREIVFRYNWVETGRRGLMDLGSGVQTIGVGAMDAAVYGNVLVAPYDVFSREFVLTAQEGSGGLRFFNNTCVIKAAEGAELFSIGPGYMIEADNNVFYAVNAGPLSLWSGHSNITGRTNCLPYAASGDDVLVNSVPADAPGFIDPAGNYGLRLDSLCRDAGSADILPAEHPLNMEYKPHTSMRFRAEDGALDIGAFEAVSGRDGDIGPAAVPAADVDSGTAPLTVHFNGLGSLDTDEDGEAITAYEWRLCDSILSMQAEFDFTFTEPGEKHIELRVRDDEGVWSEPAGLTVTVTGTEAAAGTRTVSTVDELDAALNQARSGGVNTIELRPGTYELLSPLTLDVEGLTIRAASVGRTGVVLDGSYLTEPMLTLSAAHVTVGDITLQNGVADGVRVLPEAAAAALVRLGFLNIQGIMLDTHGNETVIHECVFQNTTGSSGVTAVRFENEASGFVRDCRFLDLTDPAAPASAIVINGGAGIGIERCRFLDCDTAVAAVVSTDISIINCMIADASASPPVSAIVAESCSLVGVIHNTLHLAGTRPGSIELSGTDGEVCNNLTNLEILLDTGPPSRVEGNFLQGRAQWYADPNSGDLHLTAANADVTDAGMLTSVTQDADEQPRPQGDGPDIGADEISAESDNTAAAANPAAIPMITASEGQAPLEVGFSTLPAPGRSEDEIIAWEWSLCGNVVSHNPNFNFVFNVPGEKHLSLRVMDTSGNIHNIPMPAITVTGQTAHPDTTTACTAN